jgi:hypothetical protein
VDKRELVESRSFKEEDCFPFRHGDISMEVKQIRVSDGRWLGGRRPLVERLKRKCWMAEWGRAGGGRHRERGWRPTCFYLE